MVLENVISTVLNKVLGSYIENISSNDITLLLTTGHFELNNVRIKASAVNKLLSTSPILLKYGVMGKLKIALLWSLLRSSPLLVEIDNLRLVVGARQEGLIDVDKVVENVINSKISQLQSLAASLLTDPNAAGTSIPAAALKVAAILINSLQMNINGMCCITITCYSIYSNQSH